MRFSIVHSTRYRYSEPVYLEPHIIRLRPREDGSQRMPAFALDIDPAPAGQTVVLDQDGNTVTHAWFNGLTDHLTLLTSFQLETQRANPFDYLPLPTDRDVPVQYAEALRSPLLPYLRSDPHPDVRAFAQQIANDAGWNTLVFLTRLNQVLFQSISHVTRRHGAPLQAPKTLETREGSCRDTAVLFCAACRAVGIAARFVSGYEVGAVHDAEGGDLHAWAEVYLQGGGWRGYDPSRGLAVADAHVPVAAASDPALAAPVTGSYRGSARAETEFTISMQAG